MLRRYTNVAPPSLLQAEVNASATTLDIGDTSSYPDKFPFIVAIERGTDFEEACLVTSKTATTLTVERGFDETQAVGHPGMDSSGEDAALVEHTTAAIDYREAQVPWVTEAERDALEASDPTDMWDGRMVYNADRRSVEIAHFEDDELESDESIGDQFIGWYGLLPTGTVLPFSSSVTPPGFLRCDGSAHLRSEYPGLSALYESDGFPFGNGDGSTTFNVPDLKQRFPLGVADTGTGDALGESGGDIDHTHTQPTHTHSVSSHIHSNPSTDSDGSHTHTQGSTDSAGNHAHSTPNTNSAGSHSHSTPSWTGTHHFNGTTTGRGLIDASDINHSHSFSDGFGTTSDFHTHTSGGYGVGHTSDGTNHFVNGSSGGDSHSHTGSVSGTTSLFQHPVLASNHDHSMGSTNSGGSHSHSMGNVNSNGGHTHNLDPTNSGGSHTHPQGNTGSSGSGSTGSDGDDDTGSANPPYLALHYIVKV